MSEDDSQPRPATDDAARAAGDLGETRRAEDETIAQRRRGEDQALADRRTAQDRVLESAGHRLFLAAAAMTAAVNAGDLDRVRSANTELQAAVDAHLALGGQRRQPGQGEAP
jgi:hypothetical protein